MGTPPTNPEVKYDGKVWTLFRHPSTVQRHRRSEMTDAELDHQPWYIRISQASGRRTINLRTHVVSDAIREARAILRTRANPQFTDLLDQHRVRQSVTIGRIAEEWRALECPKPNGEIRTEAQIRNLGQFLDIALRWWGDRGVSAIRPRDLHDYCAERRATCRVGSTGGRSVDLELAALSTMLEWAVATERSQVNPFRVRPRFHSAARVTSCHQFMPQSDEELHALVGAMWADPEDLTRMIAGGHLLCCALTGLRPGEPGALLRPSHTEAGRPPGTIYTVETESGPVAKMAVARLKRGQNLAIVVRPAFRAFLHAWEHWLSQSLPTARHLFPSPTSPGPLVAFGDGADKTLRRALDAAAKAIGCGERHPHGMRAFYVRVRRAHDADDTTIASELGQSGGEILIRRTYGDPRDVRGDRAFDWLPSNGSAVWDSIPVASFVASPDGYQTHPNAACKGASDASESPSSAAAS